MKYDWHAGKLMFVYSCAFYCEVDCEGEGLACEVLSYIIWKISKIESNVANESKTLREHKRG